MTHPIRPELQKIYRFPFKGFAGQCLTETQLVKDGGIAHDRRFAVTNGCEYNGTWMPSRSFFINAVVDDMLKFKLAFDSNEILLENINAEKLSLILDDAESLKRANQAIADFMQPAGVKSDMPPPQIIDRGKASIWDYVDTPISIINAQSVQALEEKLGANLDPARFRGNLIIKGLPAWDEFGWMGKRLQIGECILDVHRPIDRCPTPGVNPATGDRDVEVTPGLRDHFGHIYCGMYAKVVQGGRIKSGDVIAILGNAEITLEETFVSNASNYALWPRMAEVTACEVANAHTKITLKTTSPWLPPKAQKGQRLKLHLGSEGWTQEYISNSGEDFYQIEIEDSKTGDPITKHVREGLEIGKFIVISGPYGQV